MRSYMTLAVIVLAASTVSPAPSAPTQYRYANPLVDFKGWAFLICGIPSRYPRADSGPAVGVFRRGRFGNNRVPTGVVPRATIRPAPVETSRPTFSGPAQLRPCSSTTQGLAPDYSSDSATLCQSRSGDTSFYDSDRTDDTFVDPESDLGRPAHNPAPAPAPALTHNPTSALTHNPAPTLTRAHDDHVHK
jgi:hypothetical protein